MLKIEAFGSVSRNQSTMLLNVHQVLTASGKITSVTEIREPWVPGHLVGSQSNPQLFTRSALYGECVLGPEVAAESGLRAQPGLGNAL